MNHEIIVQTLKAGGYPLSEMQEILLAGSFAVLVDKAVRDERRSISKKFWNAVNSCITTDELGVEFMRKFYPVHDFGHWLDGCDK